MNIKSLMLALSLILWNTASYGKPQAYREALPANVHFSFTQQQQTMDSWHHYTPPKVEYNIADVYLQLPDMSRCQAGVLHPQQKQTAIRVLNHIRHLHGLSPVSYDEQSDQEVMSASLLFVANRALSHTPRPTWKCYHQLGADGALKSNIVLTRHARPNFPEEDIIGYLIDDRRTQHIEIGHRRWLLDPFLKKVAYGSVWDQHSGGFSGSALKVAYDPQHQQQKAVLKQPYVAYPMGNYPAQYFSPNVPFSFSVVEYPHSKWDNQYVDFSQAKIRITDTQGNALKISHIHYDNKATGIANNLQFHVDGVQPQQRYKVSIQQVKVKQQIKNYHYEFMIVDK